MGMPICRSIRSLERSQKAWQLFCLVVLMVQKLGKVGGSRALELLNTVLCCFQSVILINVPCKQLVCGSFLHLSLFFITSCMSCCCRHRLDQPICMHYLDWNYHYPYITTEISLWKWTRSLLVTRFFELSCEYLFHFL